MRKNAVLQKLRQGEIVSCLWSTVGSPLLVEAAAQKEMFDCALLDTQHGYWTEATLLQTMQFLFHTSTVPLVRVVKNDSAFIGRALDLGALGVIVPLVNTPEEAQQAADAMRPPPFGTRSMAGPRIAYYGEDALTPEASKEILNIVMIETVEAAGRAEEILSVPGVDLGFIGPGDLAFSLGCFPERGPEHEETLLRILDGAKKAGKPLGILCVTLDEVFKRAEQGFQFLPQFIDHRAFLTALDDHARAYAEGMA